ncbi:MAG: YqjK-like family protein [Burkholderiales bacterium]|nr:YqjK-like family protein [Burkholderiales bacterium]
MSTAAHDLAARRHELVSRSRSLRAQLVADAQALAPVVSGVDHVRGGIHWLKHNPLWLAVTVAALVVWRPSRLWRWGSKAWTAWRFWQRLQATWRTPKR